MSDAAGARELVRTILTKISADGCSWRRDALDSANADGAPTFRTRSDSSASD